MAAARLKLAAAAALILAGFWETGQGAYIHAKAALAQVLLQNAWEHTRSSGRSSKPWRWADTWPVARLEVPDRGIDQVVLQGASGNVLAFGPGLLAESARPGDPGPVLISAHRDTHFRFLESLKSGDRIHLQPPSGETVVYRVVGSRVFDSRGPNPPPYSRNASLNLVTCYPFDALVPGGPLRFLIVAEPLDHPAARAQS